MPATRIVQVGLGPLGQMLTPRLLERDQQFRIVAAVDVDPAWVGKDLGDVSGLGKRIGIRVVAGLDQLPAKIKPQVALLTTVSDMTRIAPQIEAIVSRGIHVVTTCEELSYPWRTAPRLARRIDAAAKRYGVAVLGTGVNPGFLMDLLPITLTAACRRVDRICVSRIQDARFRRVPFQKKIGAGLTVKQFEAKQKDGTLRHVGLTESMHMIANRMGWTLTRTEDVLTPVIATKRIRTKAMTIERGMARGVQQIGRGFVNGSETVTLVFRAAISEPKPEDKIEIFGEPNIVSRIPGGVNGDIATCAITLNAVAQILHATPGLHTMTDLPVTSCSA